MRLADSSKRFAQYNVQLDRHEGKYIIHPSLVPRMVEWIEPFCEPDPHGSGMPPEYQVTTLQLEAPGLPLHWAVENEALNRFKLRVRTYGEPGTGPLFMEVKRKLRGCIAKTRTVIPFDLWCRDLMYDPWAFNAMKFKSPKEEVGFLEFVRLCREIDARPMVLIRYIRQSYFGKFDHYARVTFDRCLQYQRTDSWTDFGRSGRWVPMDSPLAQGKGSSWSGVVLELKTLSGMPQWMVDLVMEFDLVRTGNCKYSTAIRLEAPFMVSLPLPAYLGESGV